MLKCKVVTFNKRRDGRTPLDGLNEYLNEETNVVAVQQLAELFMSSEDAMAQEVYAIRYLVTLNIS